MQQYPVFDKPPFCHGQAAVFLDCISMKTVAFPSQSQYIRLASNRIGEIFSCPSTPSRMFCFS
jgi:hypothetical protein